MEQLEFTATENEAGVRIDRCLSDKYEELSRSYLQKLLKEQGVTVNGKAVKANYKIQAGDLVQTTLPDLTEPDCLLHRNGHKTHRIPRPCLNRIFFRKISLWTFYTKMMMYW